MNDTTSRHAVCGYEIIDESEAKLPLSIREVFFNFSVYESIKVLEGVPVFIEEHIERLFESAARLRMDHAYESDRLIEAVMRLISLDRLDTASLRVQMVGGDHPYLFVFSQELPQYPLEYYRDGIAMLSYSGERIEPEVKSNALLLNYLALRKAREHGAFEALLIDRDTMATEGTRSNVFGIRNKTIFTPGTGVLAGVTRKHLLSCARDMGFQICFCHTSLHEVKSGFFDEYFISSTSMGALPVREVDGMVIGGSFPETNRLHEAVCSVEQDYIASFCV